MVHEERRCESFTVIQSAANSHVKELFVNPNKRLPLQSHKYPADHRFVVSGTVFFQIDSRELKVTERDSVDIPIGSKCGISCFSKTPPVFIEVQTGASFYEDRIVRYKDDFGRN